LFLARVHSRRHCDELTTSCVVSVLADDSRLIPARDGSIDAAPGKGRMLVSLETTSTAAAHAILVPPFPFTLQDD